MAHQVCYVMLTISSGIIFQQITDLFHQLGLHNLAVNVAQESINRLLCPSVERSTIERVASEFHVSAATFFENKYGIYHLNFILNENLMKNYCYSV